MISWLVASNVIPGLFDHTNPDAFDLNEIFTIAANVIRILLWVAGVAAVAFFIIAGIMYATSSGDPAKTARAKGTIANVVIGLILVSSAYSIITLIAGRLGGR